MNSIERESIILNSAWEMIDGMVNWAMFVKSDHTRLTNLMFKTSHHQLLFIILITDSLSEVRAFRGNSVPLGLKPAPPNTQPSNLTFIFHLRQVCSDPILGAGATNLSEHIEAFGSWLEVEFEAAGVNLNAINIVADLQVARYRYIKTCGDIAKHNLARLATNAGHIRKLLKAAGHKVSEEEAYLAVKGFFNWFNDDIFLYHFSQIAEFLNNIRWAMFEYLQPEFQRSWHLTEKATPDFPVYGYRVPAEITEPLSRAMYWDLMNHVRAEPWVHRFIISEDSKQLY